MNRKELKVKEKLKILCLEDVEDDAVLIREQLIGEGFTIQFDWVSTENDFTHKLKSESWDIILSDYSLPGYSGIAALLLSVKICPEVPFICISGTIGEDLAVELMQLGAADYILKDRLSKLPVAIQRALLQAEVQKARTLAETQLKESKEKFQSLVEDINDVIFEIDASGIITYISPMINSITGFHHTHYTGKSFFNFIYEKDLPDAQEKFKNIFYHGMISPFEFRIRSAAEELVWLRTSSKPIVRDGVTVCIRGIAVDINDRRIAGDKIRKLSRAIEQSPVSVLITDLNGIITYANAAVTNSTGFTNDELIGQNPRIFSSGEMSKEEYKKIWDTISAGKEWKGEFHNKTKSGKLCWESASISPILNEKGEMIHYLAVKEDITERKTLTDDLIKAKIRAEESDKLKTAFLNNISHEVRTPLNGILGFAEMILYPDLPQEEKVSMLEILNESSERLVDTITNYMDISLIVSGNLSVKPKPVELNTLLNKVYRKFSQKCIAKKLLLIKQFPSGNLSYLKNDEELIEKTLFHLLDNAIKFTIKGSITIGWTYNDSEYELFVKDTGPGIDPEAQERVFRIFMQEDMARTRGYEGSGLGLSIAKGLVEMMGGKIRMESEKGDGSKFFITFPEIYEESIKIKTPDKTVTKRNPGDASKVILIVEDDESSSAYLKTVLNKASLPYFLAYNGKEAIEFCRTHPEISLVLMDIKMPVMDGLEASGRIKKLRKDLPIIGVSAYAMKGDKERALEAGCDEYITKPVNSENLLSVISKLI